MQPQLPGLVRADYRYLGISSGVLCPRTVVVGRCVLNCEATRVRNAICERPFVLLDNFYDASVIVVGANKIKRYVHVSPVRVTFSIYS